MARPFKQRCICSVPKVTSFVPEGQPAEGTVRIGYDEYEVLRLMDFRKMTQAECAERMGISRADVRARAAGGRGGAGVGQAPEDRGRRRPRLSENEARVHRRTLLLSQTKRERWRDG